MNIAVFPGSFDPPTYGHLNVIERASKLFDKIDVVVSENPVKNHLFTADERMMMLKTLVEPYNNVEVHKWDKLIVGYAQNVGAKVLIRGIRNASDFSYEFDLSLMNHNLNSNIETLFMPTETRYVIVKSSSIKELAQFGGDISGMVPPIVCEAVLKRYGR
ncbi:pantetheine-phosphate adenylyltransferase [Treponema pectinovorum]|uniref:pantetheine-phosphate adenylyltransferase n=1 Tax=Treponema pectinovorum TaxID=164 RepID=UPI003D8C4E54